MRICLCTDCVRHENDPAKSASRSTPGSQIFSRKWGGRLLGHGRLIRRIWYMGALTCFCLPACLPACMCVCLDKYKYIYYLSRLAFLFWFRGVSRTWTDRNWCRSPYFMYSITIASGSPWVQTPKMPTRFGSFSLNKTFTSSLNSDLDEWEINQYIFKLWQCSTDIKAKWLSSDTDRQTDRQTESRTQTHTHTDT